MGIGYIKLGAFGLIGGQIIGLFLSTGLLASLIYKEDKKVINKITDLRMKALAKKYINFPKYLIIAHGFNTASGNMPTLLLGSLFSNHSAGFFMLTQRVMGAPMALVASAIGDVFRQEASQAFVNAGNCQKIYIATAKKLILISILPTAIFFMIAPTAFAFVFGEQWRIAGEYAQVLSPMFFFRFIASPLSVMFMIAEKQRLDLIWQIFLFLITSLAFLIGFLFKNEVVALVLFSASYTLMFIVNLYMTYSFAKGACQTKEVN
jgi:O-antigen/teichoic acid export membrane protein